LDESHGQGSGCNQHGALLDDVVEAGQASVLEELHALGIAWGQQLATRIRHDGFVVLGVVDFRPVIGRINAAAFQLKKRLQTHMNKSPECLFLMRRNFDDLYGISRRRRDKKKMLMKVRRSQKGESRPSILIFLAFLFFSRNFVVQSILNCFPSVGSLLLLLINSLEYFF
jgi:hypothetical protein